MYLYTPGTPPLAMFTRAVRYNRANTPNLIIFSRQSTLSVYRYKYNNLTGWSYNTVSNQSLLLQENQCLKSYSFYGLHCLPSVCTDSSFYTFSRALDVFIIIGAFRDLQHYKGTMVIMSIGTMPTK